MLILDNLSKSFDTEPAVNSVNITVNHGETLALIGPSGCGKSTILRMIIGLVWPDSGHVTFAGQRIDPQNVNALRLKMGYVIQDGGLFPHLSGYDNVTIMARHCGWSARQISDRLDTLLQLTRFPADALQRYPAQLSGGQQQRLSLMRALMLDPELLLMDEPLGALDPLIRIDLQNELKEIFRSLRKTVVFVTHDLGEAAFLGNRIVLMRAGEIVQSGTIEALIRTPVNNFVRRFITAQRSPLEKITGGDA